jgi:hypothetical protein
VLAGAIVGLDAPDGDAVCAETEAQTSSIAINNERRFRPIMDSVRA